MDHIPTIVRHEAIDRDELIVHEWRVTQLTRLGIPGLLAEGAASRVDWHEIAKLVQRGCAPAASGPAPRSLQAASQPLAEADR